jgi:nitrogen-specific signal transduction histidine kinase
MTHLSTIARDLTDLDRAEAERHLLEIRLRESQKMESIGTLAGGVAHDFNNVLAAILGNVALARRDVADDHPAQASLGLIQQAAARARSLVQQIMTFSRRSPQSRSVQALRPLVEESLALLRSTLPASVEIEADLSDTPLWALVDAAQVQQVVLNLCTNAWQALPAQTGRVRVGLDLRRPELAPGTAAEADSGLAQACLRVCDNGIGMDAATRLRIFEPFFTTKPVGQGTGLGLAVVHGIVTASGGTISVDSQPGRGTCFEVCLPLAAVPTAAADEAQALPGPGPVAERGHGEHLLYVDDDEVVALTVAALMERAGYRVTCLTNGADALARVRADGTEFALLITDYNMPAMSGIQLAEALRDCAPALPVLISSGYVTEELQQQAHQAGVRAVLRKEQMLEQLDALVHRVLGAAT